MLNLGLRGRLSLRLSLGLLLCVGLNVGLISLNAPVGLISLNIPVKTIIPVSLSKHAYAGGRIRSSCVDTRENSRGSNLLWKINLYWEYRRGRQFENTNITLRDYYLELIISSSELPNLTLHLIKIRVNPSTSRNITVSDLCGGHFEDLGTSKTAKNHHFREWRDQVTCSGITRRT